MKDLNIEENAMSVAAMAGVARLIANQIVRDRLKETRAAS
jgi:hypothetical protein